MRDVGNLSVAMAVDPMLVGVAVALLAVVLATLLWIRGRSGGGGEQGGARPRPRPQAAPQGDGAPAGARGRRAGNRMRRAARQDQQDEEEAAEAEAAAAAEQREELEEAGVKVPEGKIGKKKLEKLQAKADRKTAREAEERAREEAKAKAAKDEEAAAAAREKEAAAERAAEEEVRRAREERERREHEEYLKMKEAFAVEEEGFDEEEDGAEGEESKLRQFVEYIRETKVVLLEDLAAHFRMKTQDAIDRVAQLQEDGALTGVVDDRGKFIYVSKEELEAVARFIRQRGRVSIAELAESSNQLINLAPPTEQAATQ